MSKFRVSKRVDLSFLGEGWKECFIEFNAPSYGEIKKILPEVEEGATAKNAEIGMEILEKLFLTGKGFDGKQKIEMTKDDLEELPIQVITKCLEAMQETPPKK
jgi:hypothetical protein